MIPALNAWARKIDIPASKLMIPLSYSAILGGTLTLIGTSTNLIVNGQYQTLTGEKGFHCSPSRRSVSSCRGRDCVHGLFPRLLPDRSEKNRPFKPERVYPEVAVAHKGPWSENHPGCRATTSQTYLPG